MSAGRGRRIDLPRVDLHSHAGRCFLAGLPAGHPLVAALGPAARAVTSSRATYGGSRSPVRPASTVLTLVHYRVSEIGDVQTEAPVHDDLAGLLRDRGLPSADVRQILGGNALKLLGHVL